MRVDRMYRHDAERQLEALLLLLKGASPATARGASGDVSDGEDHVPNRASDGDEGDTREHASNEGDERGSSRRGHP